jgi:hypothetical protein
MTVTTNLPGTTLEGLGSLQGVHVLAFGLEQIARDDPLCEAIPASLQHRLGGGDLGAPTCRCRLLAALPDRRLASRLKATRVRYHAFGTGGILRMPDLGLTHVALTARDLDASIAFYAKYAGMAVVHRGRLLKKGAGNLSNLPTALQISLSIQ